MVVVSDTTTICNLFLIDKLWILEKIYGEVIIPTGVHEELESMKNQPSIIEYIEMNDWIQTKSVSNNSLTEILMLTLDKGESQAISLAKELNANLIIIDEVQGRKIAQQMNLKVIGLLGILIQAKQENLIKSVTLIMDELKLKAGFWISAELYMKVLEITKE